jgi:uncharacterized protein YjbJ (UPF0337 family)
MGTNDKLEDKVQELGGKAKQAVGGATGDRDLQTEGLKDEKTGQVKQAGEKVKDIFK